MVQTLTSETREHRKVAAPDFALEARNLDFFYGPAQAIKSVNLGFRRNQITALIGPSGCGKSTFLRIFNRMNDTIPRTRVGGTALLDGVDIYSKEIEVVDLRKRVGMVFQRPNPFPKSIFENVVYAPRLQGERNKERLEDIAEKSLRRAALWHEVKDHMRRSAFDLSGGQQQRLCIARVLAADPEVVLMDEPTSALDPNATFQIEELMNQIKSEFTVVIVTHNMQQASRIADMTAFFLSGELVEVGTTNQIFIHPQDKRTHDYVQGRFG